MSKNGETTAFYAYHYPNEMDAYVPFCGPYLTSLTDPANPNIQKLITYLGTHTDVTTYWTQADEQTLKDFLDPIIGK